MRSQKETIASSRDGAGVALSSDGATCIQTKNLNIGYSNEVLPTIFKKRALCHQVMLLARRVVAIGAPQQVLTPEALLETFGVVVTGEERVHVLECKHGYDDVERRGLNKPSR